MSCDDPEITFGLQININFGSENAQYVLKK